MGLSTNIVTRFFQSGVPVVNGSVYFYEPGTTTLKTIYTDSTLGTPAANPLTTNENGEVVAWGTGKYKIRCEDALGALVDEEDHVPVGSSSDEVTAEAFGAAGDGVADDSTALTNALANAVDGALVLDAGSTYKINSDVSVPSNVSIIARGGYATLSGTGDLLIRGTAAGNTSDLSVSAARDAVTVTVVDGAQFSVNDVVEILASPNEHDNSTKAVPAELNEVSAISVNVLTLKYPLRHDYNIGFATEPNVTVVDDLRTNVTLQNIEFTDGNLVYGYAENLEFDDLLFTGTASCGQPGTEDGACRGVQMRVRTSRAAGAGSGPNAEVFLENLADFEVHATTYGGFKDGVRIRGCADGRVYATVHESTSRGVWMYKCSNVECWPVVVGSQPQAANTEHTLFDYSYNCVFYNSYLNERNKTLSECGEFRGDSSFCRYEGGHVFPAYTIVFEWKAGAANNVINGIFCHIDDDANRHFVSLQTGTPIADFHAMTITNCHMVRTGTGIAGNQFFFLRTSSGTNFSTNQIDLIRVAGCTLDRDNGAVVNLGGTGTGTKVKKLVVENNRCAGGIATDGDLIVVSGLPVEKLYATGNSLHTFNSARDIRTSVVDELYLNANYGATYDITNENTLVIDGLGVESANAETPTAANWRPGQVVDFTDSGDASGNGLYMLDHDAATWHKLSIGSVPTSLTDNTGGTANDTLENLADASVYANDHAAIENNFADLAAKINAILARL